MAESTVTGYFQLSINYLKTTESGTATTATTLEDTNANTALNFTDVEDLGDGLKVTTVIGLLPSTGTATAAGQSTSIALSGSFGEIKIGTFGNDQFWTVVAGDTDTFNSIVASYDFGIAKVYALSTSAKLGGTAVGDTSSASGSNIGVSVPLGAFTLMYNSASATGQLYARNTQSVDQRSQDLGVTYAFSNKTTAWVLFTKYTGSSAGQGSGTSITSDSGFESLRVMLTHAF